MDEGHRSLFESSEGRIDLSREVSKKVPVLGGELGPANEFREISPDLVGQHIVVLRQIPVAEQGGGIPKPRVDSGDSPGGGSEFRPGKAAELVVVSGSPDFLEQKKTLGSPVGRSACPQAWG